MFLEQAIYTSSKTRHGEGYHVVAKSPGIAGDIVAALNRWCPSHATLGSDMDAESLNFHRLVGSTFAFSRTVYGGKEFSGRGGLQVVSIVLLLDQSHLKGYENNPFHLARVARSRGHLRWSPPIPDRLPQVELPDFDPVESLLLGEESCPEIDSIPQRIRCGKRVAVVTGQGGTSARSNKIAEAVLKSMPVSERINFSFTTGLKWSKQRPFQLHMLEDIDDRAANRMKTDGVEIIRRTARV